MSQRNPQAAMMVDESMVRTREHCDQIIASIMNPEHYAVWFAPIVSGRRPAQRGGR